jgi:hypothetical protein
MLGILLASIGLAAGVGSTRAATTVDLDQWASLDAAWQNGNLNGNNSRYPEGGVIPFRLALEGLAPGSHEIHLNFDFSAGGHKAYDFLATWNSTNGSGAICSPSGGAISSMCPALPSPSTFQLPYDPYVADALSVVSAQIYAGMPRRMTLWGGAITSIGAPVHSGSPDGNSTVDMRIRFTTPGGAVLLAWGGHLAQSSYWDKVGGGVADGASLVTGAPWHMRTLNLDGTGNKNQDRSIQPSAIVGALPPGGPAPATFLPAIPSLGPGPEFTPPATSTSEPVTTDGGPRLTEALAVLACALVLTGLQVVLRPRAGRGRHRPSG